MANTTTGVIRTLLALTLIGTGAANASAESAYERRIKEIKELSAKTYKGAPSPAAYMKYSDITPANVAKLHPEVPDAYNGPKVRDQMMNAHKAVKGLASAADSAADDAKKSDEPNRFIASQAQKAAAVLGKAYDDKLKPAADNLGEIHGIIREMANILELIAGGNAAALSGAQAADGFNSAANAEAQNTGAGIVAQADQELALIRTVRSLNATVRQRANNGTTLAMGAGTFLNAAQGAAETIDRRYGDYSGAVSNAQSAGPIVRRAVDAVGSAAQLTAESARNVAAFSSGPADKAIQKVAECSQALRNFGAARQGQGTSLPRPRNPGIQLALMLAADASAQPQSTIDSLRQTAVRANAEAVAAVREVRVVGSRVLPPIKNAGGLPEAGVGTYAISAKEVEASDAKVGDTGRMERRARSDAATIRSQVKDDE